MARKVDLSLDNLLIAGLPNYINEFGTKKEDGQSLTTEEISDINSLIFKQQRAIIVNENIECQSKTVDSDRRFIITIGSANVKIGKASYGGCKLTFEAEFEGGTGIIQYLDSNDTTYNELTIDVGERKALVSDSNGYFHEEKNYVHVKLEEPTKKRIGDIWLEPIE